MKMLFKEGTISQKVYDDMIRFMDAMVSGGW
jgi:hypothetical protein